MRRHWLRPKWYVTEFGNWSAGTAFPESFRVVDASETIETCIHCGSTLDDVERYRKPEGTMCVPCKEVHYPWMPMPTGWRALRYFPASMSGRLDNLYQEYAERFGRRVYTRVQS